MSQKTSRAPFMQVATPQKATGSKRSIINGSAILFHDDLEGAWVAPGRTYIYSRAVAQRIANNMRKLIEGR